MCDTRPCKNGKHDDKYLISFILGHAVFVM